MNLPSITFIALCFPLLLLACRSPFLRSVRSRNTLLLLASLFLYATAEPFRVFLLLAMMAFNMSMVRAEEATGRKLWGNLAIVADVLLLLFFKYADRLVHLFAGACVPPVSLLLPVGLSYVTFREISYVLDRRQFGRPGTAGVREDALYLCNFMTVTAGPLGRYHDEIPQLVGRPDDPALRRAGIRRFALGLAKKILLADSLAKLADASFAVSSPSVLMAWSGAVAYTLVIYFDFSGYTDMAIGLGNVFGFRLAENFNLPYAARSVSDFWKRWHMSLTAWFTRYLYFPLGGSRVSSRARHVFNLWVVWFCTGLWHGSRATFLVWGMLYFILQAAEKFTPLPRWLDRLRLSRPYTLLAIVLCWVVFRAPSLADAAVRIKAMAGFGAGGLALPGELPFLLHFSLPLLAGILCSSSLVAAWRRFRDTRPWAAKLEAAALVAAFVAAMVILAGKGYTAPLYAGF